MNKDLYKTGHKALYGQTFSCLDSDVSSLERRERASIAVLLRWHDVGGRQAFFCSQ